MSRSSLARAGSAGKIDRSRLSPEAGADRKAGGRAPLLTISAGRRAVGRSTIEEDVGRRTVGERQTFLQIERCTAGCFNRPPPVATLHGAGNIRIAADIRRAGQDASAANCHGAGARWQYRRIGCHVVKLQGAGGNIGASLVCAAGCAGEADGAVAAEADAVSRAAVADCSEFSVAAAGTVLLLATLKWRCC